ncbi:hypothetical protein [Ornithinimicrobium cavernae]|uniref:hypothetical protein n=1 Tax=Ornithinimicrobium cavernae TaxID=2666047 RepID=UPI000D69F6CE|nr:hypothetical protein [Ornithinimicrobium cavernae]
MTDGRILQEGHAPTPFTAEEIRRSCRDGLRVTVASTRGAGVSFHTTTFVDGDAEGVTLESWEGGRDGTPTGPVSRARATWVELQGHASFPSATTELGEETITGPLGALRCRRYAVRREEGTRTFWFATAHPGMPVRVVGPDREDEVVELTVVPRGPTGNSRVADT